MTRIDSIASKYILPKHLETTVNALFFLGSIMSLAILTWPEFKYTPQISTIFVVLTILTFGIGFYSRYFALGSAEEARINNFFAKALDAPTSQDKTVGYYNDNESKGFRKIASQLLENLYFTKEITGRMLCHTGWQAFLFLACWMIMLIWRATSLELIILVTQLIFGEQVASRWFRLWWLHCRCKKLYTDVRNLFTSVRSGASFNALALEYVTIYERAKASACIILSKKIFAQSNVLLSQSWNEIKDELGIKQ